MFLCYNKSYDFIHHCLRTLKQPEIAFDRRLELAINLLWFKAYNSDGTLFSPELESFFVNVAQSYDIDSYDVAYEPNSVLHVMTTGYDSGGHTRVVERWIANQPTDNMHSVVLIEPDNSKLNFLINAVNEHNGEIIRMSSDSDIIQKGLDLRQIAMRYEYIVLHTHMHDPVATIAFGTHKFTRPVILFNHADHTFWIGKSIADIVFDFCSIYSITKKYRLIDNVQKCPIPMENSNTVKTDRNAARVKLGINETEKMLLTIGTSFKYTPIHGHEIFSIFDAILDADKSINLYVIGVDNSDHNWRNLTHKYGNRIKLLGRIDYNKGYTDYVAAANLIMDSYPFGGGTVLNDAVRNNTPFVSLQIDFGQNDFVVQSKGYCRTRQDIISLVLDCFKSEGLRMDILENEQSLFYHDHAPQNWNKNLARIMANVPSTHNVRDISHIIPPKIPEIYVELLHSLYKPTCQDFHKYGIMERTRKYCGFIKINKYFKFDKYMHRHTTKILHLFGLPICKI